MQVMKLFALIFTFTVGQIVFAFEAPRSDASKKNAPEKTEPPKSFANGFLPHEVTMYDDVAMNHALLLKYYADNHVAIPADVLKKHLDEIQKNLAAARQAYAKLGAPKSDQKAVEGKISAFMTTVQNCEEHCSKMEKQLEKETAVVEKRAKETEHLYEQVRKAQQSHYGIMRDLGVRRNYYSESDRYPFPVYGVD